MTLVVETGSIVANANTYVSRADYITYAASIGITVDNSIEADQDLIQAAEYINGFEDNLKGTRISRSQTLAYPRSDLYIDGWYWGIDEVPTQVILIQKLYALALKSGEDLFNRSVNPNTLVKKEKIDGAVEVEYQHNANVNQSGHKILHADTILQRLLKTNALNIALVRA